MLLGLPGTVWAVLGIEFAERLGYYAVAFSLFTYCTVMLKTGPSAANAIINVIYILIPAAAFLASGVADSSVGQPRVLAGALALYTASLLALFLSACPGMYGDFPRDPLTISKVLFALALIGFSAGYGSMKVCTNPIMADCVVLRYHGRLTEAEEKEEERDGGAEADFSKSNGRAVLAPLSAARETADEDDSSERPSALVRSSIAEPGVNEEEGAPFAYGSIPADATRTSDSPNAEVPESLRTLSETQLEQQALSRLFIYAYWISNVGGLVGSFVAPLLRNWEHARIEVGSETHSTGYYYSFLLAALSVGLGAALLYRCYHWLPHNAPAPNYVLVRVLAAAVANRWSVFRGTKVLASSAAPPPRDWLDYACADLHSTPDSTEVTVEEDWRADPHSASRPTTTPATADPASSPPPTPVHAAHSVTTPVWVADCRATLRVCKAFIALPIYWLLCNQFSTNLMYQAAALDLPDSVPEELFNNINTVTMLVFLALWDQWIVPRVLRHRVPSACTRIVCGFACMCASMLGCGFLQCAITSRGYYVGEDRYVLKEGCQKLSAGWLIAPYVLQGFSAAFVDPTVMEVAYRDAPTRMKGTVMGLYWVASSASGFLGLALSPVMKPQNATVLFFVFAAAQMAVSGLFYAVNRGHAY
ncbi:hypothetical protein ABB37_07562 [Leptomonas pyrrhocoris]|uniref:Uncharacterized protein n=1 Tax=Leptomonas pyrrhocoris TaxID=157538 RepID=A0A0M9FV56_LEPPY|nr:hypothetical protein ABB37_07562 [Leptomonas pyrrhocoris]KPA76730.1 hypothetical protein ABB37_07562 [Leptomonas pyrrhocoris]|eukprot:XP_015655169.1 hypothetical protein ABB37_07562 [Leptomonas pyrrhocoris]